jgi:hypothetical protein
MELNVSGYPDWITVTKKKEGKLYQFEAMAAKNESKDLKSGQIVIDYNKDGQTVTGVVSSVLQYGKTAE